MVTLVKVRKKHIVILYARLANSDFIKTAERLPGHGKRIGGRSYSGGMVLTAT
jgi:hypothetical protein